MSHKIEDVPRLLSKELRLNISAVRVRNAIHRLKISTKRGRLTDDGYDLLALYFKERELVSRRDANEMIMLLGLEMSKRILGRTDKYFDAIDYGMVMMNVRELNKLKKVYFERSSLVR